MGSSNVILPVEDRQALGEELIRQGEHCIEIGVPQQAEAILFQVWLLSCDHQPELRNIVAWHLAWLRLGAGDSGGAIEWFNRVDALPGGHRPIWDLQRQELIALCLTGGNQYRSASQRDSLNRTAQRPTTMPPLSIANLGRFTIRRSGEQLPTCRSRKAVSLLRYLLSCNHRSAHREELMEVLWSQARPREAAHSLHVAVSTLRRYLGHSPDSYLVYIAGQYALNPEAQIDDDARVFIEASDAAEQFWRRGDLDNARQAFVTALNSYQGDYYTDDYDSEWAFGERERLLTRYLQILERLGQIWMTQQQFDSAVECYQRVLERDSYREDALCHLMQCYNMLGRRGDAMRYYQRCTAILANDLGLEPLPETQMLYRDIQKSQGVTEQPIAQSQDSR